MLKDIQCGCFLKMPSYYHEGYQPSGDSSFLTISHTGDITDMSSNTRHRDFKWVSWTPGHIAETELNQDVLSGPFSGCPFVVYNRNGKNYVGHIGLNIASQEQSQNVRFRWLCAMPNIVSWFDPRDGFVDNTNPDPRDGAPFRVFAFITPQRTCHILELAKNDSRGQGEYRVFNTHTIQPQAISLNKLCYNALPETMQKDYDGRKARYVQKQEQYNRSRGYEKLASFG